MSGMRPSDLLHALGSGWDFLGVERVLSAVGFLLIVPLLRKHGLTILRWLWKALRSNPLLTLSLAALLIVTSRIVYDEYQIATYEYQRAESRIAVCAKSRVPGDDLDAFCHNEDFVRNSFLTVRVLRSTAVRFEELALGTLQWLWGTANWTVQLLALGYAGMLALSIILPFRQQAIRIDMDAFQQQRYQLTRQLYAQQQPQVPPLPQLPAQWGAFPPPMQQPPPRIEAID